MLEAAAARQHDAATHRAGSRLDHWHQGVARGLEEAAGLLLPVLLELEDRHLRRGTDFVQAHSRLQRFLAHAKSRDAQTATFWA
jgi:hypothetical protein